MVKTPILILDIRFYVHRLKVENYKKMPHFLLLSAQYMTIHGFKLNKWFLVVVVTKQDTKSNYTIISYMDIIGSEVV